MCSKRAARDGSPLRAGGRLLTSSHDALHDAVARARAGARRARPTAGGHHDDRRRSRPSRRRRCWSAGRRHHDHARRLCRGARAHGSVRSPAVPVAGASQRAPDGDDQHQAPRPGGARQRVRQRPAHPGRAPRRSPRRDAEGRAEGAPKPQDLAPDEVRAYYDAHRADFRDPERRRVSAIVLPTQAAADGVLDQAKKGSAAARLGRARAGEVDRSVGQGERRRWTSPGDLGMVSPPGDSHGEPPRVPEEVRAALFSIGKVGDVRPRVVPANGQGLRRPPDGEERPAGPDS